MIILSRLIPIYSSTFSSKFHFQLKSLLQWNNEVDFVGKRCYRFYFNGVVKKNDMSLISLSSKQEIPYKRDFRQTSVKFTNYRLFSSDSDSSTEQIQKALENKEFQDLLKDFAKDFGVNAEINEISKDTQKEHVKEEDLISDEDISARTKETLDIYHSISKERFKEFEDKDSNIIYSYEEELHLSEDTFFHIDQDYKKKFIKHDLKRGITGVFDIEELVPVLRAEKCFDISVMQIPKHYCYADFMVLVTARSLRHARAVSEFILKFYKMKKDPEDPFIKIEGEKLGNWKVMDMGNIVLHVFLEDIRYIYDLESLWLLDRKYDTGGNLEKDELDDILQEELEFFNCLKSEINLNPEEEKENIK